MLYAPPVVVKAVIVAMTVVMEIIIKAQVYIYNMYCKQANIYKNLVSVNSWYDATSDYQGV